MTGFDMLTIVCALAFIGAALALFAALVRSGSISRAEEQRRENLEYWMGELPY